MLEIPRTGREALFPWHDTESPVLVTHPLVQFVSCMHSPHSAHTQFLLAWAVPKTRSPVMCSVCTCSSILFGEVNYVKDKFTVLSDAGLSAGFCRHVTVLSTLLWTHGLIHSFLAWYVPGATLGIQHRQTYCPAIHRLVGRNRHINRVMMQKLQTVTNLPGDRFCWSQSNLNIYLNYQNF